MNTDAICNLKHPSLLAPTTTRCYDQSAKSPGISLSCRSGVGQMERPASTDAGVYGPEGCGLPQFGDGGGVGVRSVVGHTLLRLVHEMHGGVIDDPTIQLDLAEHPPVALLERFGCNRTGLGTEQPDRLREIPLRRGERGPFPVHERDFALVVNDEMLRCRVGMGRQRIRGLRRRDRSNIGVQLGIDADATPVPSEPSNRRSMIDVDPFSSMPRERLDSLLGSDVWTLSSSAPARRAASGLSGNDPRVHWPGSLNSAQDSSSVPTPSILTGIPGRPLRAVSAWDSRRSRAGVP